MLRGPMTGIANYTFHVMRALLEQGAAFQYRGFSGLGWGDVDLAGMQSPARADPGSGGSPTSRARGHVVDRLAGLAIKTALRFSHVRPVRAVYRATYRRGFAATVRSQHLDLFHAFNFRPPSDPGVPVLPVVYDLSTFRHPELHPADRVAWLAPLGDIVARAPMVQTISEFSKNEIVSTFGTPADKIFVAPPAAAALYRPMGLEATRRDLAGLDLTPGAFFLTVGTLEPRKNIRALIAAFGRLSSAERARCPLAVVGGKGWGDLDLPAQAEALRREGTLRFLEGTTNLQLRSLYEGARLMLMPSLYEGFGMPVVEALACGTAVAHSAETSMDEISGALGRRVAAPDIDAWTDVLRDALAGHDHDNAALRDARVRQARQFDWRRSAELVIAAYGRVIPG